MNVDTVRVYLNGRLSLQTVDEGEPRRRRHLQ